MLGGDLEVRQLYTPISAEQSAFLAAAGTVSAYREMRAMARTTVEGGEDQTLISLKAVDDLYPVFGTVEAAPAVARADWFTPVDGRPAAIVDGGALRRLGLGVGDEILIGDGVFVVAAELISEPDRLGGGGLLTLGPRVMIAAADLESTGLVQAGSLIYHYYKLTMPAGGDLQGFRADLSAAFPDARLAGARLFRRRPGAARLRGPPGRVPYPGRADGAGWSAGSGSPMAYAPISIPRAAPSPR